ncbi:MAG: hypothetical protein FJ086_18590 [Deltaproteobacteria bacterium]|nr:hypothetical protein [Deltaproteobacteria bacterium]
MSKALVCPCGDVTVEDLHDTLYLGFAAKPPTEGTLAGQAAARGLRTREAA